MSVTSKPDHLLCIFIYVADEQEDDKYDFE